MSLNDSFSGIPTFVITARSASFTDAGERLGISKSAVGKAIARLERRLGVMLFHRTTRRLSLTADGEAYLAACSGALDEIRDVENCLTSKAHEPSGQLRVDMPVALGRRLILPVMLDIGQRFPGLSFMLTFNDHLIDPVEEGVDLVIRFGDPGNHQGLIARPLTQQRLIICAAPAYLRRNGTPQTLTDVHDHACIVSHRRGQPLGWRVAELGDALRIVPPGTHQVGDGLAMIDFALAGLGLCQMPLCVVREHLESGALVSVLSAYEPEPLIVYALWPKTAHLRPKVRCLIDTLIELGEVGKLE
ncbi:LysR family transcriptional regulator [Pseudomonas graminis]|uniref:LysR family transcriptional regulator n=1 Tax=Pseudomonas graminis TaxID=158627 RepID=UPI00105D8B93|nr:LysR family transcriptional regulator [Pseudomonas graminis]TDV50234.1 LysR family transcriptional regulator [Pseudomonas graminis]